MADEQIDYEDEEYGGAQKLQYQGSGAIPALAEEEMGEDDEYDDLYNDVNIGENFLQMHRSEAPPAPPSVGNGGFQPRNSNDLRVESGGSQGLNIPGVAVESKYSTGTHFPEQNVKGPEIGSVGYPDGSSIAQKTRVMEMTNDSQARNMGFQGSTSGPSNIGVDPSDMNNKISNDPTPVPNAGVPRVIPQLPASQMNMNMDTNRSATNENQIRPPLENGSTMLYVGELHWWTTDAELENVLSQYGMVKEIKFFDERASGKSKGYCQVEFYDAAAAAACKEGMNGHLFNGRACVVAFASQQTLKQMGASYMNKNQGQPQSQNQGRRPMNDGAGRGGNMNYQGGDAGRNFGRGGWGRGGQGILNRGPGGGGRMGGRGGSMGAKNIVGGAGGVGSGANGGGYGQGLAGPAFGGPAGAMLPPQSMMRAGFDPTYMGRGAGYGGFAGPGFPGMLPSFPAVNAMGLAGVAPHVNPAFFGRGMAPNGMGMMGPSGMDGPNAGMWSDTSMGGWGEEPGRRTRESSYGGDDGASEYGYGEVNHEKGARSSAASREKERASERDWSGNSDRRHRDDREHDWDRSEREHKEHRYREEKESYRDHRQRERDSGYEDDWDRGQSSSRSRSRSRAVPEEDYRSRSRDADYGKRRRLPSE
ncbi:heterogeneous nuclear ribonucleoproteins A1 homolog [Ricinus communis]|uniref:RNA binding protein, putative n=1 Tax=Ricinus communis TaxID=3988 RepID=B9RMS1_RICCO|nr:heterogeneous nuclear ribonucleoproteins A1 homolog [Ricinus communis]XP_025012378.1 heterogeneous nuclear ribonucleoproteins A1 homolog [Ricinus communis]EEF47594.1 RNA binding protein, putative [Ricinus communis]|eukprot:XP_015572237.1 heterogeneous nuclear ribonucleoproteins A1 homolog [Ricinus communis]